MDNQRSTAMADQMLNILTLYLFVVVTVANQ